MICALDRVSRNEKKVGVDYKTPRVITILHGLLYIYAPPGSTPDSQTIHSPENDCRSVADMFAREKCTE
jgi:hypothetical protein